jgi:hypothetical protein
MSSGDLSELGVKAEHLGLMMKERDRAAAHDLNSWYRRYRRMV